METRFGHAEVGQLAADPNDASVDRTASALEDASVQADGYVGIRYKLPLPAGDWPLLIGPVCDLARLALYDDRSIEEVREKAARSRALLKKISTGVLRLTDGAGAEPSRLTKPSARSDAPRMTRAKLGMVWP